MGGDINIADDPHDVAGVESAADRDTVWRWFSELTSTRLNNPKEGALLCTMQRLHQEDVTGRILDGDSGEDWVHYCVPMEFEAERCCQTVLGWTDPRGCDDDGEPLLTFPDRVPRDDEAAAILEERENSLMWPERFGQKGGCQPEGVARALNELGAVATIAAAEGRRDFQKRLVAGVGSVGRQIPDARFGGGVGRWRLHRG